MAAGRFGRFTVLDELGSGGMGRVYRAHDPILRREVCIKVLRDDLAGAAGNLLAEARSASALSHPNICTVFDVGDIDGTPFIAMELVEGGPLSDLIVPGGLPTDAVLRYGIQIASALAHAHQHGIVHGDLKGPNVLVTPGGLVKVLDFGLARKLEPATAESFTRTSAGGGGVSGTLPFMAPETIRGAPLTPSADIWALGVLLYEMVAGRRPFKGENAYDLASAITSRSPQPFPASVPSTLATVIARCLEKDPAHRYANARELFVALEPLVSGSHHLPTVSQTAAAPPDAPAPQPSSAMPASASRPARGGARRIVLLAIAAIVLAGAGGLVWRWLPVTGAPPMAGSNEVTSLIVLPFDNLSGNSDDDYFANGMTEALITDLSRIPTLTVISRTSSMRYKSLGKSPRDLARELRIQSVVDGSVLRSAGQVRISVRLVDAATDRNLWGREYTRELKDVLALQGEVARAIAGEIRASFAPADEERLKNAPSVNPAAHEEFLKGSHHWNRRTEDALMLAIAHYRRALELQPDFAPAYAGLARSYIVLPAFPIGGMPPREAYPQVIHNAERAIALDERLAEAHAALAYVRLHSLDSQGAEASFRRALALNPGDPTTRFWYAAALASMSRFEESIEQARQAAALDPIAPIITAGVSWMHHLARRFDLEIEAANEALRLEPNFMIARYRLGEGYLNLGRYDEAIVEFTKAHELSGESPDLLAALAYARGRAGQTREARAGLRALNELAATRYVSPYAVALVHTGLGDLDEAIGWLERAIDERAWGIVYLPVEPDLDPLRSDRRFDALLARVTNQRP